MRVLFYAVNGLGLGHVTRLTAIARQVMLLNPSAKILFITSSEADSIIYKEGFPAVKVPSKNIACESGLEARLHARLIHQSTWGVFSAFRPNITVVDTFPSGFCFELDPVLMWKASKFVFVYRQRQLKKTRSKRFQAALEKYDLILVPHDKGAFGVEIPEGLKATFAGKIIIRSKKELLPRQHVIQRFNLPPDKTNILITLGGGGQDDIETVINRVLTAFRDYPEVHPVVAQGSLLRRLDIGVNCETGPTATVIKQYYPLCELYNAFDFAVAGCGYNTVNELLYFNKPAVYLPFERQVDDQFMRAQQLTEEGLGLTADPADPQSINTALEQLLDPGVQAPIRRNLQKKHFRNNARKAARAILRAAKK